MKKHNYFYKITNLVNGKFYYGIHSTNNLEDGYMGSGQALKNSIKKYGKSSFTLEIVQDFTTRKEALEYECMVVNENLVKDENCYNLRTGGGEAYFYSDESKSRMRTAQTGKETPQAVRDKIKHTHNNMDEKSKKIIGEKIRKALTGKKKSEEHVEKVRKALKNRKMTAEQIERLKSSLKGRNLSNEHIENIKKGRQVNHPENRKCIIEGIVYNSYREASKFFGVVYQTISSRVNSKKEKWKNWNLYKEVLDES